MINIHCFNPFRCPWTTQQICLFILLFGFCSSCFIKPPPQQGPIPSTWIRIEVEQEKSVSSIQEDVKAIVAQLPNIVHATADLAEATQLETQGNLSEPLLVGATTAHYLHLLRDATNANMEHGRFIETDEIESNRSVIVIDEDLANDLFGSEDVLDESVTVSDRVYTIIGVIRHPTISSLGNVKRDCYVPLANFESANPHDLVRIWIEMDSLPSAEVSEEILSSLLSSRNPGSKLSINSSF